MALVVLFWAEPASAYTWMIRHAYTGCGVCHADPSGGELLTAYGRMQGKLLLRMRYGGASAAAGGESTGGDFSDDDFAGFDDVGSFDESSSEPSEGVSDEGDAGAEAEDSEAGDEEEAAPEEPESKKSPAKPKPDTSGAEEVTLDEEAETPKAGKKRSKGKNAGGGEASSEESEPGFLWGLLPTPPSILLGGGYRSLAVYQLGGAEDPLKYIPVMMGDLYFQARTDNVRVAASVGITKVKPGSPHGHAAQVTQAQGYTLNMISRSHWLGFDMGDNDEYLLRFGRVNLPFGVRVPEHTLWAREATRTDRESDQQHGVALAYTGDKFRMEAMGILGNYQVSPDSYRERGYSLFMEYFTDSNWALGASSLTTFVQQDRILLKNNLLRQAHGLMARAKLVDWLVLMAEADVLLTKGFSAGYVGFAQFDIEAVQGLHFLLTGEFLNQGQEPGLPTAKGVGEPRLGAWASIDWFFYDQFEFRIDAVQRQGADTQLLGQLHFYL